MRVHSKGGRLVSSSALAAHEAPLLNKWRKQRLYYRGITTLDVAVRS